MWNERFNKEFKEESKKETNEKSKNELKKELFGDEFYEEMKILCQYRLNTRLDSFYVSSYQPISNSFTKPSLEFTQSNGVITHDAKYTVFRDTDDRLLAEHIIKKLTMYDEYQIM